MKATKVITPLLNEVERGVYWNEIACPSVDTTPLLLFQVQFSDYTSQTVAEYISCWLRHVEITNTVVIVIIWHFITEHISTSKTA